MDTWTRLEPHARKGNLQYGLDAEVHDPLWLLARQWQLLEFWGEDAGSPIWADLTVHCAPMTRYCPSPQGPTSSKPNVHELDGTVPLETLVEREFIQREPIYIHIIKNGNVIWELRQVQHMRFAAEAGVHFVRLMEKMGAGILRTNIVQKFSLAPTKEETTLLERLSDWDTLRFLEVMAGRVPDGVLLRSILKIVLEAGSLDNPKNPNPYQSRVKTGVADWQAMTDSDRNVLQLIAVEWKAWHDSLISEPHESSWVPPRLEYQALISASTQNGEVALSATEYADGHLDWYSFDAVASPSLGAPPADSTTIKRNTISLSVIPTPVTFPGMPASRYWEFEDANIDFGSLVAGEQQLAHLLLVEFGLVSGDDWFVIPVVLPVGTLCATDKLVVSDTFGGAPTVIKSARIVEEGDPNRPPGPLPWNLFHLSIDKTQVTGPARSSPDALFLPPTLGRSLQGKAIEEVLFMRDEMANMVWAVERTLESALGRPLSQSEAYFRARKHKPAPSGGPEAALNRLYRLASEVPPHWIPMLPVPMKTGSADQLGLMAGSQAKGRVMRELGGTPLYGEEVPREGVRVMRAYQYARWTGGETYLWVGRRNEVGRGEGSSGLIFDQLVPLDEN